MTAEQDTRIIIEVGDYLVDERTGEICGLIPQHARFAVTDRDSAEWVLERLFEAEAEAAALIRRKVVLLENIESMQHDCERRAIWLRERFGAELQAWAAKELEGKKTRTLKTVFGRLSFRRKPARLTVHDEERALAWCEQNQPQAVKVTKRVLVSEVVSSGPDFEPPGFTAMPETDVFSIKTGAES